MDAEYKLNETYEKAREEARSLRRRDIPWEEQEEFFTRHRSLFGSFFSMALARAKLAYPKYQDNVFWYPMKSLVLMMQEEVADAMIYLCVLLYGRELTRDVEKGGDE